ncbi:MAG: response regulator [Candidatus Binataceae bacterium]|nr:response regulator [Candidatus Binataceae bacterium]
MEQSSESRPNGKTILIVDDEFGVLEVLEFILSDLGYHVVAALNGQEALARLRDCAPDLIVLDLMMPIMDGAAVLQTMQSNGKYSKIPVILTSALREQNVKERCSGYSLFLRKPFKTDKLLESIQQLLAAAPAKSKPEQK